MINLGDRLHAATEEGIVAGADEIDAGGGQTQAQFNASIGSSIGETADSSVSSTIFGWLKSIRDFLVDIVTTNPYAKEASVKDGDDTTIGILKDIATDAEVYAMFPGAVDENGNISLEHTLNADGYIVAEHSVDENGVITLN